MHSTCFADAQQHLAVCQYDIAHSLWIYFIETSYTSFWTIAPLGAWWCFHRLLDVTRNLFGQTVAVVCDTMASLRAPLLLSEQGGVRAQVVGCDLIKNLVKQ